MSSKCKMQLTGAEQTALAFSTIFVYNLIKIVGKERDAMGKSFSRATVTADSKPFLTESKCDFVGNGFFVYLKNDKENERGKENDLSKMRNGNQ